MNVLRTSVHLLPATRLPRHAIQRAYATTARPFVPPAQLRDLDNPGPRRGDRQGGDREPRQRVKPPPESPSFYTSRPVYYDQIIQLEKAIGQVRGSLKTLQLLPLPAFARASLPPLHPVWKTQDEMTLDFETKMTTTRYRKVTKLLSQLNEYNRIARTAGCTELADGIDSIVSMFESGKKDAFLARGKRKVVILDEFGRSYTVGRRKTSSARVWMIPVRQEKKESPKAVAVEEELNMEELFGVERAAEPETVKMEQVKVTTSTILVNNLPLNEYFSVPADRERATRPFKVAGVLGAYNVFAIVRGGGTTGQSDALLQGIAKGLVAHEPELTTMFRRAKLTRRDPRMVERKKTGLAKARKRYTWVKR
ncbi:SSU ribosomal protein S9P [Crucibulum laeve]|uniref:SSU ribosomal protein S9P n=1 Tax=Crucibulum laeve TaxID=68775 RepID=A0A5C3MG35_9AGAR|nr:SSU ribosomal protein S9P [Crucibulum laeve]